MKSFFKMQTEENIEEKSSGSNTLAEYACDENSTMGGVCDEVGVEGIRLSRNVIALQDEGQVSQLITQPDDRKSADASASLSCTDFTPWQHMNAHRQKLEKRIKQARKMFPQAKRFVKKILAEGGRIAIGWRQALDGGT